MTPASHGTHSSQSAKSNSCAAAVLPAAAVCRFRKKPAATERSCVYQSYARISLTRVYRLAGFS